MEDYLEISKDTRYPEELEHIDYDAINEMIHGVTGRYHSNPKESVRRKYDKSIADAIKGDYSVFGRIAVNPGDAIVDYLEAFGQTGDRNLLYEAKTRWDNLPSEMREDVNMQIYSAFGRSAVSIFRGL